MQELPASSTIEGVLEEALFCAGFISAANHGDFHRIHWTRSSRTDKGVHSLSTVIGVRVTLDDTLFDTDPEGICFAKAINKHLPATVRVFSVQRTTKKFNTRLVLNNGFTSAVQSCSHVQAAVMLGTAEVYIGWVVRLVPVPCPNACIMCSVVTVLGVGSAHLENLDGMQEMVCQQDI